MRTKLLTHSILFKAVLIILFISTGSFKFAHHGTILNPETRQAPAVLLNNESGIVPFKDLSQRRIVSINAGSDYSVEFNAMLGKYSEISSIHAQDIKSIQQLSQFNTFIFLVKDGDLLPKTIDLILAAEKSKQVIVACFGNTAALAALDPISSPVIWNPEHTVASVEQTAQIIFGGEAASGTLNQNVSSKFINGSGFSTVRTRLRYIDPEAFGISQARLGKIDAIVNDAIRQHATPSAVVMVVKDGNVIFNKAYGHHTYDENDIPTRVDDIYDLASVTKIAATTIAAMRLYDQNKLDLDAGLGTYLEDVRATNKSEIPLRDVLLHQAGFVNLDFFSYLKPQDHSTDSSELYSAKIADHYYLRNNYYKDVMWEKMLRTPLPTRGRYVYSDISMYVMKEVIEKQTLQPLDQYMSHEFYSSLGMRTAGFNPIKRFAKDRIVPTEMDGYFRKTLLQGIVHDSGASLANGVAGHAGLFASANDLAILNQMLLNGGSYGGVEYIRPETVSLFTSSQSNVSRRGLGFDRGNGTGYPSDLASPESFGHTGYTGTCVWVDPNEKLVYIFLSNRVYPSASNKLNSLRVRARIQDAIYEAISGSQENFAQAR
ncbi:serine hydrolase [Flavihumibacter sp. R14]|nr:serine hydrolase [Flavihumibacter soli]